MKDHIWAILLHEILNLLGIFRGLTGVEVILGFILLFVGGKKVADLSQPPSQDKPKKTEQIVIWPPEADQDRKELDYSYEPESEPEPAKPVREWQSGDGFGDSNAKKRRNKRFTAPTKNPQSQPKKQVEIPFNVVSLNCLGDKGEKTIASLIEELKQVKGGVSIFALQEVDPQGQLLKWAPGFLKKELGGKWEAFLGSSGEDMRLAFLVDISQVDVLSHQEVKNRFPQGTGRRVPLELKLSYRGLTGVVTDIHFARRKDQVEVDQSRAADSYLREMQKKNDFVILVGDQNSDQNADDATIHRKGYGLFLMGLPKGFQALPHSPSGVGTFYSKKYAKSILDEATVFGFKGLVHILGLGSDPNDPDTFQLGGSDHRLELITGAITA